MTDELGPEPQPCRMLVSDFPEEIRNGILTVVNGKGLHAEYDTEDGVMGLRIASPNGTYMVRLTDLSTEAGGLDTVFGAIKQLAMKALRDN